MKPPSDLLTAPSVRPPAAEPAACHEPLRIGLLCDRFPDISQTFVTTLAAGLAGAGHDLRILTREEAAPKGPGLEAIRSAGLDGRIARASSAGRFFSSQALALAREQPARTAHLAALWALDQIAPRHVLAVTRMMAAEPGFDVMHCQFATLGLTAMRHRRYGTLRTRALVVHLRGYDITSFVEERGARVYDRLFREADLFVANCGYFRDRAIALGCSPEKVVIVGSPIDTALFSPPARRPSPDGRAVRLAAVGRLVEKKGFVDAIDAVAILASRGYAVRLDILGEGECRAELEARIVRTGLEDRVTLHGAATPSQVMGALHQADLFLAPSVTAASGDADAAVNTAKEAMATGLPIVATHHGGIPELVVPGENGELVPERDPAALADAVGRLIDDPESWPRLGAAGRRKVVAEYDRHHILQRTLDVYRTALARAGERDYE